MGFLIRSLASLSGLRTGIAVSCGVGHRHGSDLVLLQLWCRPTAAAPIQPLAWEPAFAAGAALEKTKRQKKKAKGMKKYLLFFRVGSVKTKTKTKKNCYKFLNKDI